MKKNILLLLLCVVAIPVLAQQNNHYNLMIAPATLTHHRVTLLWDKQYGAEKVLYEILLNGKLSGNTGKTNFTFDALTPATAYKVAVRMKGEKGEGASLSFKTKVRGRIFSILDFGAKADTSYKNTKAIQAAINACTAGGVVYIPKGIFVSGALFLKSDMTLYIDKGAVLKGSTDTADYLPLYRNRFEGWELSTYASLLNAGTLNRNGSYNVKNLRITGGGTIEGGGKKLGNAMISARGIRSRGRLICLMNCQDVSITSLTIQEPPCWTIHYIYSDNITLSDLHINSYGIRNGDGIDPDSSTDSYIFNCTFDNGDDCIAVKSGKNPEGFYVGKPTTNVRVTNCNFIRGHGISIGSEMSGGVSDVLVQDCKAGALINGIQIKGTKERGGYVNNVTVTDCELMKITVFSALNYNNDGEAAPEPPTFENFVFKNINLSKALIKEPVININGFTDPQHRLRNVRFENLLLPAGAKVLVTDAEHISFTQWKNTPGDPVQFLVKNGTDVTY
ncbi:MAG: glycoside hydrolase family 28 protein [Ferruginibacter sp.]